MAERRAQIVNIVTGGGYLKVHLLINLLFNFLLSFVLIILASPLFLVVALIIKLRDGGPVIYKGERLGLGKKLFTMYKFRTMVPNSEKIIGAELLTSNHNVVTPTGKYLRDTRLDELPQLFNIIKGDMDFVGPRPERPAIYENICKHIKGYDKRFSVKPGLIGYSQLFTPHSSPKRIRTIIDNAFIKKKQIFLWDMFIVNYTILIVVVIISHKLFKHFWKDVIKARILHRYKEKRNLDRLNPKNAKAYIISKVNGKEVVKDETKLIDINENALCIKTNREFNQAESFLKLEIDFKPKCRKIVKKKFAICTGKVFKKTELKDNQYIYSYVIQYTPISPINYYKIHQYFLSESVMY